MSYVSDFSCVSVCDLSNENVTSSRYSNITEMIAIGSEPTIQ
jgi:hypothetical protein